MVQKTIFELDLIKLAKWQRRSAIAATILLTGLVVVWVGSGLVLIYGPNVPSVGFGIVFWIFYLFAMFVSAALVFPTHRAMGYGLFNLLLWALLAFLIPILILLSIASTAGLILKLSGAKVGMFGVSKDELDRIRPHHCRQSGYSREGLELLQDAQSASACLR